MNLYALHSKPEILMGYESIMSMEFPEEEMLRMIANAEYIKNLHPKVHSELIKRLTNALAMLHYHLLAALDDEDLFPELDRILIDEVTGTINSMIVFVLDSGYHIDSDELTMMLGEIVFGSTNYEVRDWINEYGAEIIHEYLPIG